MKNKIDFEKWERKELFKLFGAYTNPYFSISANIECTKTYIDCKKNNESFYIASLYKILKAINAVQNFKYRIDGHDIYLYDNVQISPTVGREDGTFGFSFMEYTEDFEIFKRKAKFEIERIKNGEGLMMSENSERLDTVYFTTIPWFSFTDINHPFDGRFITGIPSLATGKIFKSQDKMLMPLSVTLHHGFADGRHAALFYQAAEKYFNE